VLGGKLAGHGECFAFILQHLLIFFRIFIIEGLLTILVGIASFWVIQDFPDTAKFLTDAERAVVVGRLQADDQFSAGGENLKVKVSPAVFDKTILTPTSIVHLEELGGLENICWKYVSTRNFVAPWNEPTL
jgi:hypothetical protein